jgi:hypothetical protein
MDTSAITLLVPTTPEERRLLGAVYRDYGNQLLAASDEPGPSAGASDSSAISYVGDEGEANLRRFVNQIAPNARHALRAIADETIESGTAPDSDRVRSRMNLGTDEHNRLGGMLTSVGFAVKRTDLPRPYADRWGGTRQIYEMDPEVAETLRRILDDDGNLR